MLPSKNGSWNQRKLFKIYAEKFKSNNFRTAETSHKAKI